MRLPVDHFPPLIALVLLAACGAEMPSRTAPAPLVGGPAADYPIVLGPPFTVNGVTYTPADKMNIDEVGYAIPGSDGGAAISAAHRTLPLPSYVEVTSLQSGKTILVRVERRGPMDGDGLVELSPGAVAQLGADPAGRTPVRVRRVNPPEAERAALRSGQLAPGRMDTPKSLVAVLLRKLGPAAPASPVQPAPVALAMAAKPAAKPAVPAPQPAAAQGRSLIQVGAFASKANAEATATRVGGTVSPAGRFWRVRMGPYSTPDAASAALAKVKAAGYSDARIQRAD